MKKTIVRFCDKKLTTGKSQLATEVRVPHAQQVLIFTNVHRMLPVDGFQTQWKTFHPNDLMQFLCVSGLKPFNKELSTQCVMKICQFCNNNTLHQVTKKFSRKILILQMLFCQGKVTECITHPELVPNVNICQSLVTEIKSLHVSGLYLSLPCHGTTAMTGGTEDRLTFPALTGDLSPQLTPSYPQSRAAHSISKTCN